MANEKDAAKETETPTHGAGKAVKPAQDAVTTSNFVKTQANYKGKDHSDLVQVKFTQDSPYGHKAGTTELMHPATAELMKAKGIIEDTGKPFERPRFEQKDVAVDV